MPLDSTAQQPLYSLVTQTPLRAGGIFDLTEMQFDCLSSPYWVLAKGPVEMHVNLLKLQLHRFLLKAGLSPELRCRMESFQSWIELVQLGGGTSDSRRPNHFVPTIQSIVNIPYSASSNSLHESNLNFCATRNLRFVFKWRKVWISLLT